MYRLFEEMEVVHSSFDLQLLEFHSFQIQVLPAIEVSIITPLQMLDRLRF